MLVGVGADIMRIDRIGEGLSDDDPFIRRGFTEAERSELQARDDRRTFIASRFSAKEAVFKTLDCGGNDVRLPEVEIVSNEHGRPVVNLYGAAAAIASARGIDRVLVSLSYESEYVLAFAVAEAADAITLERE